MFLEENKMTSPKCLWIGILNAVASKDDWRPLGRQQTSLILVYWGPMLQLAVSET